MAYWLCSSYAQTNHLISDVMINEFYYHIQISLYGSDTHSDASIKCTIYMSNKSHPYATINNQSNQSYPSWSATTTTIHCAPVRHKTYEIRPRIISNHIPTDQYWSIANGCQAQKRTYPFINYTKWLQFEKWMDIIIVIGDRTTQQGTHTQTDHNKCKRFVDNKYQYNWCFAMCTSRNLFRFGKILPQTYRYMYVMAGMREVYSRISSSSSSYDKEIK